MAESNEESLLLAFKESGVEFIEEADKAVGELGEQFKDLDKSAEQAIEVLKSESTVVDDLEAKIKKLKQELEALADAHKSGLIAQDNYKERSDALIKVISENETVLKRLTASQREAEEAAERADKAAEAEMAGRLKAARAIEKEIEAQKKLAEAAAEAAEAIAEEARAQKNMEEIALESGPKLQRMTDIATGRRR